MPRKAGCAPHGALKRLAQRRPAGLQGGPRHGYGRGSATSSSISACMAACIRCIRPPTSASGRRQFSVEKPKTVRCLHPQLIGGGDDLFERPVALPVSEQPVLALGMRPAPVAVHDDGDMGGQARRVETRLQGFELSGRRNRVAPKESSSMVPSDFKQLGFFGFGDLVDLGDIAVGQLLQAVLRPLGLIFGGFGFFSPAL